MFYIITSISDMGPFMKEIASIKEWGLDIETSSLDTLTCKVYSIQLSTRDNIYFFDLLKFNCLSYLAQLLTTKFVIGHNLKFDLKVIKANTGIALTNCFCTQLAEVCIFLGVGDQYPSLVDVVYKYAGVVLDKSIRESFYNQGELKEITQEQIVYAAEDVKYLHIVKEVQLKQLEATKMLPVWDLEMRVLPVIVDMEIEGITLDKDAWLQLEEIAKKTSEERKKETITSLLGRMNLDKFENLYDLAVALRLPIKKSKREHDVLIQLTDKQFYHAYVENNLNLGSTYQLASCLNLIGIPVKSTGESALLELNSSDPIIENILSYRGTDKLISTYGQNWIERINPKTGKIHLQFNQLGTATGRLSSGGDGLNGQNIPREGGYRQCFIAPNGSKFINIDFNQQEFRLCGSVTGDPVIIQAYVDGYDMHRMTASILYNVPLKDVTKDQRQIAKSLNFAILYGSSAGGLAWNFKITKREAQEILNKFYKTYSIFKEYKDAMEDAIIKYGYAMTQMGRRRYFEKPEVFEDAYAYSRWVAKVKKEGFNLCVQGTGADITKLSMVDIYENNPFGDLLKPVLQQHDELLDIATDSVAQDAYKFVEKCMLRQEQKFLGDIPAAVEGKISQKWEH